LSNYKFVKDNMPWVSSFKIRGSYGTVGNDRISNSRFPYLTLINSNAGQAWGANGYGLAESIIGADNLAWERAIKADVGIDASFLKDRLTFTVDFFNDQRSGIFQRRTQIPDYVGVITMPYGNVGSMRSYGSDGNIAFTQNLAKGLNLTVRANYTYSTNYVQTWEQAYPAYDYQKYEDNPLSIQRGFISLGLFKDELDVATSPRQFGVVRPGDIKYKDVNGDGVINSDDIVPLSYSNFPRLMYGFGFELQYNNFTLGAMFRGTGRTDFYHVGTGFEMGYLPFHGGKTGNVLTMIADQKNRWTPASYSGDPSTENPNAKFPRLSYGPNENNSKLSTFWQDDSRYLRLQELSINYNLKAGNFLKKMGVSSMNLQLIGYDLFVWDNIKIFHPEQAARNGSAYPIPARFAAQVYINF
jgi:TonB-linked outer membrane protein, SusC/RagA family